MNLRLARIVCTAGLMGLKRGIVTGIMIGLMTGPVTSSGAWARATSGSSDSGSHPDLEFLNLPAFDIVQISPEGNALKVGDELQLKLDAQQVTAIDAPGVELSLDEPPAEANLHHSLHDQGWDLQKQGRGPDRSILFSAIPLKAGPLTLPSLAIKDGQGKNLGRTNPISYQVTSAIQSSDPQPEEPESLEPPVGLAFPIWIVVLAVILVVAVVSAIIYGIYRWQKKRNGKTGRSPEIQRTEDEIALLKLFELEQKKLIQHLQFKIYYFTVSEILKAYLSKRYQFDAVESTTQEILRYLERQQVMSDSLLDRLEGLFNRLDQVKFTDFLPDSAQALALMVDAREWIQQTRRVPTILSQSGVGQNAS